MDSGGGGGAVTEMQRSRNAAKESCVAASASVADRRSFVIVRVRPVRTCGWVALSVDCGQGTELEGAASCDCRVEADICTRDSSAESELPVW